MTHRLAREPIGERIAAFKILDENAGGCIVCKRMEASVAFAQQSFRLHAFGDIYRDPADQSRPSRLRGDRKLVDQ
jgi:hypothetical protein